MEKVATFRFHGSLLDFLPESAGNEILTYSFTGNPSIKDAIEALGVPHVEVDIIKANGTDIQFNFRLLDSVIIDVFPPQIIRLPEGKEVRFIADGHLGKLAKELRIFGFDTYYQTDLSAKEIIAIVKEENRVVLTRSIGLLKHKALNHGYWLRSQQPEQQLQEVIRRFDLLYFAAPFRRCLECNGLIIEVAKDSLMNVLPPKTILYFNEFYQCRSCKRVYWKGSHYERMQKLVKRMLSD